jgi:hypothetical protein
MMTKEQRNRKAIKKNEKKENLGQLASHRPKFLEDGFM